MMKKKKKQLKQKKPSAWSQYFSEGEEVEVLGIEEGLIDSWYAATILEIIQKKKNQFLIQYRTLMDDTEENPLEEYVHVDRLRPFPPEVGQCMFRLHEDVDVWDNDGWWKGKVCKVLGNSRYSVFFEPYNQEMVFKGVDLRVHMEWIDGKWLSDSPTKVVAVVEQNGRGTSSQISPEIPVFTTGTATQLIPSADRDNSPKRIHFSLTDISKRLNYESTSKEEGVCSDLAPDAAFRLTENVTEVEAAENQPVLALSTERCHDTGTPMESSMDVEADYASLFTSSIAERRKLLRRTTRKSGSSDQLLCTSFKRSEDENHVEEGDNHVEGIMDQICEAVRRKRGRPKGSCKETRTMVAFAKGHGESEAEILHQRSDAGQGYDVPLRVFRRKRSKNFTSGSSKSWAVSLVRSKCLEIESNSKEKYYADTESSLRYTATDGCGSSKSWAATLIQSKCLEIESNSKEKYDVDTRCMPSYTETDGQTPMFLEMEESRDDKDVSDAFEVVEKVCTQLLTTPEGYQAMASCLEKFCTSSNGDSDVNNHLENVQTDCSQLLCSNVEEHQTITLCHKKLDCWKLEDEEGNQLISSEAVTEEDKSVKCLEGLESSDELGSSLRLETPNDERESSVDVSTNERSSPTPQENVCLPFTKSLCMWETIESMDAFNVIPQRPHFHPLLKINEEFCEGIAMGYMLSFTTLMESTRKACLDNMRSVFEDTLVALSELETLGFTVQLIRILVEQMLELKDRAIQAYDRLKMLEMELAKVKLQSDSHVNEPVDCP